MIKAYDFLRYRSSAVVTLCRAKSVRVLNTQHRAMTFAMALLFFLSSSETAVAQIATAGRKHYFPPEQISVMPVVFTPKGEKTPDTQLDAIVMRHLKWTQRRYGQLLGTTFEIENKVRRFRRRIHVAIGTS